jgi:hypothetical protein
LTAHLFENIPFEVDTAGLLKRLRIRTGSARSEELLKMVEAARPIARPCAVYMLASLTDRGDDWVAIDGIHFCSRVLRVNLERTYRVFPFLATCGQELQAWAKTFDDMLLNYWAEAIKEAALFCALDAVRTHLVDYYQPGHTASMNPGSLEDWPIEQQRSLFELFGPHAETIGVQLTDSMLMIPTKSVSGIRFATEATFESCQLCPREGCPGRRAEYDPNLYDSRYCLHSG